MRIDSSQLFTPIVATAEEIEAEKSRAGDYFEQAIEVPIFQQAAHKILSEDEAQSALEKHAREAFEKRAIQRKQPKAWHIQHDGWLLGSVGLWPTPAALGKKDDNKPTSGMNTSVSKALRQRIFIPTGSTLDNRIFAIHDGQVFYLKKAEFQDAMHKLQEAGQTDPSSLMQSVERLVQNGHVVQKHSTLRTSSIMSFRSYIDAHLQSVFGEKPKVDPTEDIKKQTIDAFVKAIGPAHGVALKLGPSTSTALTNWLNAGDTKRRLQALESTPAPLAQLIENHAREASEEPTHAQQYAFERMAAITQRIDQGQPWFEEAAGMLKHQMEQSRQTLPEGFEQAVVRGFQRLARMPNRENWWRTHALNTDEILSLTVPERFFFGSVSVESNEHSDWNVDIHPALALWGLGMVEKVDAPRNPEQWESMVRMLKHVFSNEGRFDWESAQGYRPYFRGFTQELQEQEQGWIVPGESLHEFLNTKRETIHWLSQAIQPDLPLPTEGMPAVEHFEYMASEKRTVDARVSKAFNFKQWMDAGRTLHRFHEQATQRAMARKTEEMAAFKQGDSEPMWEPGGPMTMDSHGVHIKALCHPLELLEEGDGMDHCVAGYSSHCFSGRSRIYALHHVETGERATLEIEQVGDENPQLPYQVKTVQLQGPKNMDVSMTIKAAARQLIKDINQAPQAPWPRLETPAEWTADASGPDALFFEQVRAWFRSKHKGLAISFLQERQAKMDKYASQLATLPSSPGVIRAPAI